MDRTHVIGHYQVPDPTDPTKFGGIDHHTDPGPNWDWTTYMALAQQYAAALPSPPRLGPSPVASLSGTTATVSWQPARTCHAPVASHTVTAQPGGTTKTVSSSTTAVTFAGLAVGTVYTFTVTATNADGSDSLTSNGIVPGSKCTSASVRAATAAPLMAGLPVLFAATATGCPAPRFEYWVQMLDGKWYLKQPWTGGSFNWNTAGLRPGRYTVHVWANKTGDQLTAPETIGSTTVTLTGCTSATLKPAGGAVHPGTPVTFTATAAGCPNPVYEFWIEDTHGKWHRMTGFGAGTWTWNNTGWGKGTYHIHAWANQLGSFAGLYQAFGSSTYVLD
jgi:hypothetical protein